MEQIKSSGIKPLLPKTERRSDLRDDLARESDGGGAGVGIDDDFEAVIENGELDEMAVRSMGFERFQAGLDHGVLKFAGVFLGHASKFSEAANGAAGGSSEARVGIEMQRDAFRVSGHWCPRE